MKKQKKQQYSSVTEKEEVCYLTKYFFKHSYVTRIVVIVINISNKMSIN